MISVIVLILKKYDLTLNLKRGIKVNRWKIFFTLNCNKKQK